MEVITHPKGEVEALSACLEVRHVQTFFGSEVLVVHCTKDGEEDKRHREETQTVRPGPWVGPSEWSKWFVFVILL